MSKRNYLVLLAAVVGVMLTGSVAAQRANPTQAKTDEYRRLNYCQDPWVAIAVVERTGGTRPPLTLNRQDFECDISAYNQGRWNSYNELYNAVDKAQTDAAWSSLKLEVYALPNNQKAGFLVESNGTPRWAKLVGNDGSTLVGNDGASLIGTDSAGLIATVISRMVAAGAGNLIPVGGSSLKNYVTNQGFFSNPRLISNSPRVISDWGAGLMNKMTNPPRSLLSDPRKYVKYGSVYYVIK